MLHRPLTPSTLVCEFTMKSVTFPKKNVYDLGLMCSTRHTFFERELRLFLGAIEGGDRILVTWNSADDKCGFEKLEPTQAPDDEGSSGSSAKKTDELSKTQSRKKPKPKSKSTKSEKYGDE